MRATIFSATLANRVKNIHRHITNASTPFHPLGVGELNVFSKIYIITNYAVQQYCREG